MGEAQHDQRVLWLSVLRLDGIVLVLSIWFFAPSITITFILYIICILMCNDVKLVQVKQVVYSFPF